MNKPSPVITARELRDAELEALHEGSVNMDALFGAAPGRALGNHRRIIHRTASGYRGIFRLRGRRAKPWVAQIRGAGRRVCLGTYATDKEAALAYDRAARMIWGGDAVTNFPRAKETT